MASVDFGELTKTGHVLSGKDRGVAARQHFKLDDLDKADLAVEVYIPEHVRNITSSFFLGMFSRSVLKFGSREKFFDHYKFKAKRSVLRQIDHGIDRALMKRSKFEIQS